MRRLSKRLLYVAVLTLSMSVYLAPPNRPMALDTSDIPSFLDSGDKANRTGGGSFEAGARAWLTEIPVAATRRYLPQNLRFRKKSVALLLFRDKLTCSHALTA